MTYSIKKTGFSMILAATAISGGLLLAAAPALAGSVEGTVVDSTTGKPLIAAQVSAVLEGAKNPEIQGSVDSGVDGKFSLEGLPNGTYTVSAMLKGYRPAVQKNVTVSDGAPATIEFKASRAPY